MVQKEQRVLSHYLLGQKKAVARTLHYSLGFDRPIPSKFSQDQKKEDKKWRMWVVQVVWVKKHNIIRISKKTSVGKQLGSRRHTSSGIPMKRRTNKTRA